MTACATSPEPEYEYTFQTFEALDKEPVYASELPELSELECYPSADDCQVVGYTDGEDVDKLEAYTVLAESNSANTNTNAEIVQTMLEREAVIIAAGRDQENITNFVEQQLAWEREQRNREKWYYRLLLGIVTVAGMFAGSR